MTAQPGGGLNRYLLPHGFQIAGLTLAFIGFTLSWLHFGLGYKPGFLNTHVFAVHSEYFDTKYFRVITNNVIEEICGIILLTGLFFLAFSREKREQEHFWPLRVKSFLFAFYTGTAIMLFSFFFLYGLGFMKVVVLNIYIPLILYIISFRYLHARTRLRDRN